MSERVAVRAFSSSGSSSGRATASMLAAEGCGSDRRAPSMGREWERRRRAKSAKGEEGGERGD